MSSLPRVESRPNNDQLASLAIGVDDQLPGSPSWLRSSRGRYSELGRSHRDLRALKVVDLARVKINQPSRGRRWPFASVALIEPTSLA
jgi:hypothetical protein